MVIHLDACRDASEQLRRDPGSLGHFPSVPARAPGRTGIYGSESPGLCRCPRKQITHAAECKPASHPSCQRPRSRRSSPVPACHSASHRPRAVTARGMRRGGTRGQRAKPDLGKPPAAPEHRFMGTTFPREVFSGAKEGNIPARCCPYRQDDRGVPKPSKGDTQNATRGTATVSLWLSIPGTNAVPKARTPRRRSPQQKASAARTRPALPGGQDRGCACPAPPLGARDAPPAEPGYPQLCHPTPQQHSRWETESPGISKRSRVPGTPRMGGRLWCGSLLGAGGQQQTGEHRR